jgi:hypothetical protein
MLDERTEGRRRGKIGCHKEEKKKIKENRLILIIVLP